MMKKSNTRRTVETLGKKQYTIAAEGILVGCGAGIVSILYRIALDKASNWTLAILSFCKQHVWFIPLWFLILLALSILTARLIRLEPLISGSGIPQVEGEMNDYIHSNWWKVLLLKFAAGVLCMFGGLSLGREGPSIQLGAMAGKGLSRSTKRIKTEEKFLITCGASAGLAAAFNAPLAGVMFALEEMHKNFSVTVLMSAMGASIAADFISKYVFGLSPVFHFPETPMIPLNYYWLLLLLGILLGALGAFYNKITEKTQNAFGKIKSLEVRLVIPFFLAGILGLVLPDVLGGGHGMIERLTEGKMALALILLFLLAKFIFSMVSFGSGAVGGIFFPLLVLGAYIGGAFGNFFASAMEIDPVIINNLIILGMAGYFSAIVRAPITGIILISEMTGTFTHLLSLSVVCVVSYLVADLCHSKPIYEQLLERLIRSNGKRLRHGSREKILMETVVNVGSPLCKKKLGQLHLPDRCLLVAIRRGEDEFIPHGESMILAGDTLVVLAYRSDYVSVKNWLSVQCAENIT